MFNLACTSDFLMLDPYKELWKDFFLNDKLSILVNTTFSCFLFFNDFFFISGVLFDSSF